MASAAFQAHVNAVAAGAVTKHNINGLRKLANALERGERSQGYGRTLSADTDEMWDLEEQISKSEPRVSPELHESGLAVLRNKRYAKRWNDFERDVIAGLTEFRFKGLIRLGSRGQYSTPVYRAVAAGIGDFLFYNLPWQSGGNGPVVVQEHEF